VSWKKNLKIGIVGAGIQGISNALFLQKKGFK
jgi:D-amino-acid dehydrogenase